MTQYAKVFFEIEIGGQKAGRIVMKLYQETPMCSENFRALLRGSEQRGGLKNSVK